MTFWGAGRGLLGQSVRLIEAFLHCEKWKVNSFLCDSATFIPSKVMIYQDKRTVFVDCSVSRGQNTCSSRDGLDWVLHFLSVTRFLTRHQQHQHTNVTLRWCLSVQLSVWLSVHGTSPPPTVGNHFGQVCKQKEFGNKACRAVSQNGGQFCEQDNLWWPFWSTKNDQKCTEMLDTMLPSILVFGGGATAYAHTIGMRRWEAFLFDPWETVQRYVPSLSGKILLFPVLKGTSLGQKFDTSKNSICLKVNLDNLDLWTSVAFLYH